MHNLFSLFLSLSNVLFVSFYTYATFIFYFQFNFVGRILGPRGMTAKELEQYTGCKIMVRGKGSMRDKAKVCISVQCPPNLSSTGYRLCL